MEEEKHSASGLDFKLHPLVLINISDHHTRMKANAPDGKGERVLGCLLGTQTGRTVDISNSFELKYSIQSEGVVIDEAFRKKKQEQYLQVFPKLYVVGWYATGSAMLDEYLQMHRKAVENNESPVFLLFDPVVDPLRKELPVKLFETELHVVDGAPSFTFVAAHYTMETSDAERIGVDQVAKIFPSGHASGSEQLTAHFLTMHTAIKMLNSRVRALHQVLAKVQSGEVPFNHSLLRQVSSLVSSLPALDTQPFHKDFMTEYNDTLLTIYLSSMTNGVYAANEVAERFATAYERPGRRRGGGLP